MSEDRIYSVQLRQAYEHVVQADSALRSAVLASTADQVEAADKARAELTAALEILAGVQS